MAAKQTPAEKLAAKKPRLRKPRNTAAKRNAPFVCEIRKIRESLNLSLRDVAKELGMSIAGLHAIEHGTDPMLSTVFRLCRFYGIESIERVWSIAKEVQHG